ncbi:MAG: sensor histidine kinase [Lachnospiraceae bacterium]|nr:sensor histidine kinase [Lachnospiraceae bacterium]
MSDKRIRYVKYIMLILNIAAVSFPAFFIYITTEKICDFNIARNFIGRTNAIPQKPEWTLYTTIILLVCLLVSFLLREFVYQQKMSFIYSSLAFDFLTSCVLMIVLDFNYNGILFWVFANIIYYVQDKVKLIFMLVAILIYVGTDHEFLTINYHLYSINDYIGYYNAHTQQYLLGGYNMLVSLNIIIFILFCIYVIQTQQGIIEKVNSLYSQLSQKNEELEIVNEELKQFADIKEKMGKTKERNRLAREIHDTLGHTLTGISAGIDACLTMIDSNPQVTKKQLEVISKVTRDGIGEIRRSVNELRPDSLERLSLDSAIRNMIEDMTSVSQAEVFFQCDSENLKFDEDEENTIYRIVQESITNALRHGKANKIWVTIQKEDYELHVQIKDNGIGCIDMKKGFGTKHMQERLQMLHGTVSYKSEDGFLVHAVIPIRWGEEYD